MHVYLNSAATFSCVFLEGWSELSWTKARTFEGESDFLGSLYPRLGVYEWRSEHFEGMIGSSAFGEIRRFEKAASGVNQRRCQCRSLSSSVARAVASPVATAVASAVGSVVRCALARAVASALASTVSSAVARALLRAVRLPLPSSVVPFLDSCERSHVIG